MSACSVDRSMCYGGPSSVNNITGWLSLTYLPGARDRGVFLAHNFPIA